MLHSLKKMFKSNYLFTFGVIICLFWIIMAIIAPFVAPYDPVVQDLTLRLKAPSAAHIFGTDNFGRDIFSRVIYGGRYSLLAGCLSVIIAGRLPDGCDRRLYRYDLRCYCRLCRWCCGQCHDASFRDDSVFPVTDPGNDYQCSHGFQSV